MAALLVLILGLKIVYAHVFRVDSDEPQHLHVVWGWVHGLMPYRDVFDNHMPLFQLLCAPFLWAAMKLFGERPDIVVIMRIFMIPFFAASFGPFWREGRKKRPRL